MGTAPKAARALKFSITVKLLAIISISLAIALCADAKTWRNAQGTKSFEGEFASRTANDVTIRQANNKTITVAFEKLHEDDRFWIAQLDDDGKRWGMDARTFEPDRWLVDGDTVTVGNLTLDVIHCPGHTPGHIVFYHAPSHFAVVGDVLFQGSIGRTDFPRGNHQDLIDSITKKLWPLGNETAFVPGHGPMSTFGHERKTNAFVSDYLLA